MNYRKITSMGNLYNSGEVAKELNSFSKNKNTVLFAGAGVGQRVGLPTWSALLSNVAEILVERDLEIEAALVKKRIDAGDFLGAATVIRTCEELISSEKYTLFSQPFVDLNVSEDSIDSLEPFVKYPAAGIVTTNFDRSLLRASSKFRIGQFPITVELNDESMRGAATRSDFILARIHGRVEIPNSLQLASEDYRELTKNQTYVDFVSRLLEYRSVLFVGFSFLDPAINLILQIYKDAFGPVFPVRHAALVPGGENSTSLLRRLREVNIEPIIYDPKNHHHALWDGFRIHYEGMNRAIPELGLPTVDQTLGALPETELHRFLAFAYTQSKPIHSREGSLADLVKESIVLATIAEDAKGTAQQITVETKIREKLKISPDEASQIVSATLDRLEQRRQVIMTGGQVIQIIGAIPNESATLLDALAKSIVTRMRVVYAEEVSDTVLETIPTLLEEILLARAWDIGAYYSGASAKPSEASVLAVCNRLSATHFHSKSTRWKNSLAGAIRDLFANPSREDAPKLARLGRAAFAVQLAFASPRATMFQQSVLPDVLYFDASIILPAIVDGHPFQKGYQSAVLRLIDANRKHGTDTPRRFGGYFLEEIIHHREKAILIVEESGLQDSGRLQRYVSYSGAQNVNVFISGYAAARLNKKHENEKFSSYLQRCAPYTNNTALANFLRERFAIEIIDSDFRNSRIVDYNLVFNDLKLGYELAKRDDKSNVLIHHEAEQLVALLIDLRQGKRPLFVTADAMLRKVVSASKRINRLSGSLVSEVGLIGLVDLLVGLSPNSEVYTRLLWGMPCRSVEEQVRDYLIGQTVSKYNQALLVQMPELVDRVVSFHKDEFLRIAANGRGDVEDVKGTIEFVDRVEADYLKQFDKKIAEIRQIFGNGAI